MNPNAQTFTKEMAQDGNEEPVYFNEVHNKNNWWVRHRRRQRLADFALFFSLATAGALYFAFATGVL